MKQKKGQNAIIARPSSSPYSVVDVNKLEDKAFQNVKDQIGFCGIWCGSCVAGNGAIVELTRRFEEVVRKYNLEKWAPKGFDFKEFEKGLASIQSMRACVGCQKGGGSKCEIRTCALEKEVDNCSQCSELIACKRLERLEKYPEIKEKLKELRNSKRQKLGEKWMSELRTKWPHCVVFCSSAKGTMQGLIDLHLT